MKIVRRLINILSQQQKHYNSTVQNCAKQMNNNTDLHPFVVTFNSDKVIEYFRNRPLNQKQQDDLEATDLKLNQIRNSQTWLMAKLNYLLLEKLMKCYIEILGAFVYMPL